MKTKLLFALLFLCPLVATTETTGRDIVVAIIDTGIDEEHPELRQHLWNNSQEIPGNKIDDDGNGFVDDLHGWNFVSNSPQLSDNHGHGTHVAGIIAGRSSALPRISSQVKIMVLKYYDPKAKGSQNLLNSVRAIRYAIEMKADIINYSGGGPDRSALEEAAIREASAAGIVFIAAAGNDGANNDKTAFYPANYRLPNVISVAAIDGGGELLSFSNYGSDSIDLALRGKNIYSTLPEGQHGFMTGTSQATALLSACAAHVMLQNSKLIGKPQQLLKALLQYGKKDQALIGKTKYRVSLDPLEALKTVM